MVFKQSKHYELNKNNNDPDRIFESSANKENNSMVTVSKLI